MIFLDVILAAIVGTAAFLQAESKGWRLLLAAIGIVLAGLVARHFVAGSVIGEALLKVLQHPNQVDRVVQESMRDLRLFATAIVVIAGCIMALGVALGALLGRWQSPGKTGGLAFVGAFLLINILIYSLAAGS